MECAPATEVSAVSDIERIAEQEYRKAFLVFENADRQLATAMAMRDRKGVARIKPVWEQALERYRQAQAEWERCL